MLQMLSTQLTNHFNKIKNEELENIEDAARILCNTVIGDGTIYWYGVKEMKALMAEVVDGPESFPSSKVYSNEIELTSLDRVVIATRFADDTEACEMVKHVQEQGAEAIVLSAVRGDGDELVSLADFHIDTKLVEPLVPIDTGNVGLPTVMTMFFAYFCLYVTVKEILADFEGPLPTFE